MAAKSYRVCNPAKSENERCFLSDDPSPFLYVADGAISYHASYEPDKADSSAALYSSFDGELWPDSLMMNRDGDVLHLSAQSVPPTIARQEQEGGPCYGTNYYTPIPANRAPWHDAGESPRGNNVPVLMVGSDPMPFKFPWYEEPPIGCANSEVSIPTVTPENSAALSNEPVEEFNLPTQLSSCVSRGVTRLLPRRSSGPEPMFEFALQEMLDQHSFQSDSTPFTIPRSRLQYLTAGSAFNPSYCSALLSETPTPASGGPSNEVSSDASCHGGATQGEGQVKAPALQNLHALVRSHDDLPASDPLYFLDDVRNEGDDQDWSQKTQAFVGGGIMSITDERPAQVSLPARIEPTGQVQPLAFQGTPHSFSVAMIESQLRSTRGEATTKPLPVVRLGRGMNIYDRPWNAHYRGAVKFMSAEYKKSPARSKRKKKIIMDILGNYQFESQDEKSGHWERVSCPRLLKKKVQLDLRKA
jgi:hypothetical protein